MKHMREVSLNARQAKPGVHLVDTTRVCFIVNEHTNPDIGKSTGPRSSTGENSGGPMKTIVVPVLLSGKKNPVGSPSMGTLMLKKNEVL